MRMEGGSLVTLRAMRAGDLELVGAWLGDPVVARWYVAGSTSAHELEQLRRAVSGIDSTRALIVLDEGARPIGWCQWYLCEGYPEHAAGVGAEPGDVGIDYAIGESARRGGGVGTALIGALVSEVRRSHPAAGIVADPEAANRASRRVLEKNGFRLLAERPVACEAGGATMAIYRLAPPSART